jgi:hypothetical protein
MTQKKLPPFGEKQLALIVVFSISSVFGGSASHPLHCETPFNSESRGHIRMNGVHHLIYSAETGVSRWA